MSSMAISVLKKARLLQIRRIIVLYPLTVHMTLRWKEGLPMQIL